MPKKCKNKTRKGTRCGTGQLCGSCYSRRSRAADPVRYAFNNLKNRAKQRNKEFSLTLDQFRQWCHKYNYIQGKGKHADGYTVDRIDNDKGYHIDNIQPMKNRDNASKGTKRLVYNWWDDTATVVTVPAQENTTGPF